ncbi:cysteine proteinase [Nadsonia fulvescens var. elongata DSM 6958]|uniref:Ubiquitin carboxyl-terminal hydrolase n=1 Tax=Nadsonia fulvescens var. elongata DSM 6958 TaxID=857566 RepID=A0A1E3PPG5_9ASCO|nr:cysteine proteinase [Nadsonia fulvescens var. elongata DSM 6958]
MSTIPVVVKHSGKKYDVELNIAEPGLVFKMQLYSLTGVAPERQKILAKGGQLKDDTDMSTLNLKPGHVFMLIGSAGALPAAPATQTNFIEDMSDRQIAETAMIPAGLANLGNTCYLNSTVQALKNVPELMISLKSYKGQASSSGMDLTTSLKEVFNGMNQTAAAYSPYVFLTSLRSIFPQFAERSNEGFYKQQDAEEAWSQILSALRPKLMHHNGDLFIDKFFGGKFETTLQCDEAPEEEPKKSVEDFLKLSCHITKETNFLRDGLLNGVNEKIEKTSELLGRNAQYTLTKRISRLPKYLTVQYVRFYWRRDIQKKAKILRKVAFPFELDVTELCTEELKKDVIPVREKIREIKKEQEEAIRSAKRARVQNSSANDADDDQSIISTEKLKEYKQAYESVIPEKLKDDGSNPSALYELAAIVSHQGASADSGHYQCFAKNDKEGGKWWRFNDDKVSIVDQAKIETLAGGGESDSALILLYRAVEI